MIFKTLKHRQETDMYGYIMDNEIWNSTIPVLQPMTATLAAMVRLWTKYGHTKMIKQSRNYKLVKIKIKIIK